MLVKFFLFAPLVGLVGSFVAPTHRHHYCLASARNQGEELNSRFSVQPPAFNDRILNEDRIHLIRAVGDDSEITDKRLYSRRDATALSIAAITLASTSNPSTVLAEGNTNKIPFSASWSAVDGLKSSNDNNEKKGGNFVSFDISAYKAMKEDPTRTPIFREAIRERLANLGDDSVVLDLGTGPFALFAIIAAELGAGKVYAIEADAAVAANARSVIEKSRWSNVITVLEGFSTDISLPEKVDLCIAEICGSVATEEGAFATIKDAHARFLKNPNDPSSWIPQRIQTYAAPASYTLHNLFGPPEFDWSKLNGEPVRFNCRDEGLQLLADPVLVEDFAFADIQLQSKSKSDVKHQETVFTVDPKRVKENYDPLYDEFRRGNSSPNDSARLAEQTSTSFSGIALWPRLFLGVSDDKFVIDSRSYPTGDHQRSHWQTVLPIMASRPIGELQGGEKIAVSFDFNVPAVVTQPPKVSKMYNGNRVSTNTALRMCNQSTLFQD